MAGTGRTAGGRGSLAQSRSARIAALPAIVFPLCFLVLSTITILVYRGGHATEFMGTAYDFDVVRRTSPPGQLRYNFLLNFVSDLGRIKTYHGGSNLASACLFCLTLGSAGLGFFFYFRRLRIAGLPPAVEARFLGPARILGQGSALAFAGIGWAPVDGPPPVFALHLALVFAAFGSVMGICILMAVMITRSDRYPRLCALGYVLLFAALALFMGVMTWWGLARTLAGYLALTVGQKVIVSLLMANFLAQGIVAFRLRPERGVRGQLPAHRKTCRAAPISSSRC